MSYRIKIGAGSQVLDGTTPAVIMTAAVTSAISAACNGGSFAYARKGGAGFQFFDASNNDLGHPVNLAVDTLNSAVAGIDVLVDTGDGHWVKGTVMGDGTGAAVNGVVMPLTAPAARVRGAPPALGASATAAGVAADGTSYFKVGTDLYEADAITTVGALSGTGPCFVEISTGTWTVASL